MTTTEPTGEQILAVPMGGNDADAATIREYLVELATAVWRQGDSFSGKRPFGNSDWQWGLSLALADSGLVPVTSDRWNDRIPDHDAAGVLIERALNALAHPVRPAACDHDYREVKLSPERALIRITVSACRLCGQPEPRTSDG